MPINKKLFNLQSRAWYQFEVFHYHHMLMWSTRSFNAYNIEKNDKFPKLSAFLLIFWYFFDFQCNLAPPKYSPNWTKKILVLI